MVKAPQMGDKQSELNICLQCKGARLLCGRPHCPILLKYSVLRSTSIDPAQFKGTREIFGASPPAVFVGHQNYPKVNVGPLIPIGSFAENKNTHFLDSPEEWFGKSIDEIVAYRSGLLRTNFSMNVYYQKPLDEQLSDLHIGQRKLLESTQELTMSANSVDTEAKVSRLRFGMLFETHSAPQGPSGRADSIKIVDNIKVLKPVDIVVNDIDLKAGDAVTDYLYKDPQISLTSIQRLFSAGLLGIKKNRRLVPTRWSITAVDDIIGKELANQIHHFPTIDKYYTFCGEYLDNKFIILFAPGLWAYEMNECWNTSTLWNQAVPGIYSPQQLTPQIANDYEYETGRKNYADHITGAYYAARKEIEEFLLKGRRQARVIVFREVSSGYLVPLGVWVIRETVKQILSTGWKGMQTQTHETIKEALQRIGREFTVPIKLWIQASHLLPYMRTQRYLDQWIQPKIKGDRIEG